MRRMNRESLLVLAVCGLDSWEALKGTDRLILAHGWGGGIVRPFKFAPYGRNH